MTALIIILSIILLIIVILQISRLTELYARKLEGMTPEEVTGKDYYQANKLVLEEQKLSLDKNAQMLEFAKLFGIPEREPIPLKDEEVVDAQLGPSEDEGDKPEDSQ